MKAVIAKTLADVRRRKLQSLVIAFVILLSSGATTLALSLLVESNAPYDHAFAAANGAHLALTFAADKTSLLQLRSTAYAHGVTAAAGPWPEVVTNMSANDLAGPKGPRESGELGGLVIVGRDRPNAPVDRLTIESGRWARGPGEIVLSRSMADATGLTVGSQVTAGDAPGHPSLRIVGVAASISPGVDAWVTPRQATALASRTAPLLYQMLYRVHPAGTDAELRTASQSITAHLPAGAVVHGDTYLEVKIGADRTTAVMIPFLLAFSVFALLAAAMIIGNVVTGVVIASYREIGIMKSVGFAPIQVVLTLLGQILIPTLAGLVAGVALGTLGSQPFLQDTAHALGLPAPFTAAIPVDALVLAGVLLVATLAAWWPSQRAGCMSAVAAITTGSAPVAGRTSALGSSLSRLPLPRPVGLGLADALARPLRSAMTTGAIIIGVTTVVFALSLHLSLGQVAAHLLRTQYVQVNVNRQARVPLAGTPPPQVSDRRVTALLRSEPGTARFVAETVEQVSVSSIAEPIPFIAYRGASSWIGYALIAGRWFSGPDEAVAPTKLLTQTHLRVGDSITARLHGRSVRLRIVGEILDQSYDDLLLRANWATLLRLDPTAEPLTYEVGLKPGVDANAYANRLRDATSDAMDAWAVEHEGINTAFLLLNGVVAGLALVLTSIAVAGVFNTVVLTTREKARDVAILKAVGMAPRQVVVMVVASVAALGLVAGIAGIPIGLILHREILGLMGQIATGTDIPASFYDLINHAALPLLALCGVVVAALGAWVPARWAAASPVAEVLQAE